MGIREGHSRGVVGLCYLSEGSSLVSAGIDQSLRVWHAALGRPLSRLENHTGPIHALAICPAQPGEAQAMGATFGADKTLRLWQPKIGRMVRLLKLKREPLAVNWTTFDDLIAVACADGHVLLLEPETLAVRRDVPAIDGRAHSIASFPGGRSLAIGVEAGRVVGVDFEKTRDPSASKSPEGKGQSP